MNYEVKLITDPRTGESCHFANHPSGLRIYVKEMPGFSTAHALFATKYGSVNTTFKTKNDADFVTVPEGIAHFLEHKLFENEDCDVFELYAKTGADGNAFTSFDKTAYLFSCTKNFKESLEILLDFVQKPYFTEASVAKEQGIIAQEIKMGEDNPYNAVFYSLLSGLYANNPVKIDIAGTVESISQITPDLLYRCYNTFYNLNNMVLSVAGNCKLQEVLEVADKLLKPCENVELECIFPEEPKGVANKLVTKKMPVGIPLFALGFKAEPSNNAIQLIEDEYICSFLTNMIFGQSSRFFKENIEAGLINSGFMPEVFCSDGYFSCILSGESKDPYELQKRVYAEIERVKKEGLDKQEFLDLKKARYASSIRMFADVMGYSMLMMNTAFAGVEPYTAVEICASLEFEELEHALEKFLNPQYSSMSVVEPQ